MSDDFADLMLARRKRNAGEISRCRAMITESEQIIAEAKAEIEILERHDQMIDKLLTMSDLGLLYDGEAAPAAAKGTT